VWKKLNLTQQKHAFTNQKKCTTTQNKHKKLKSGLVAFYDIRPGKGRSILKGKDKKGMREVRKNSRKKISRKEYDIERWNEGRITPPSLYEVGRVGL